MHVVHIRGRCAKKMANFILRYYKPRSSEPSGLPSPSGQSKRGHYRNYNSKEQADIGKYGVEMEF